MPWVTVTVLREDVENALQAIEADYHGIAPCPIERALCRALALPLGRVCANYDLLEVREWKDYALVAGVPTKKMAQAMEQFDLTGKMKPSIFRIKLEPVE